MRTYYFDMRDGIPIRDRKGLEFPTAGGAIEHSKSLARQMRDDPRAEAAHSIAGSTNPELKFTASRSNRDRRTTVKASVPVHEAADGQRRFVRKLRSSAQAHRTRMRMNDQQDNDIATMTWFSSNPPSARSLVSRGRPHRSTTAGYKSDRRSPRLQGPAIPAAPPVTTSTRHNHVFETRHR